MNENYFFISLLSALRFAKIRRKVNFDLLIKLQSHKRELCEKRKIPIVVLFRN